MNCKICKQLNRIETEIDQLKHNENKEVQKIALGNYLDIVKMEYQVELGKKVSFENRAGILLTLFGVIVVFLFGKLPLNNFNAYFEENLTIFIIFKLISLVGLIITTIFSIYQIMKVLTVSEYENFGLDKVDDDKLIKSENIGAAVLFKSYQKVVIDLQKKNNIKAERLKKAIMFLFGMLLFYIIYSNL